MQYNTALEKIILPEYGRNVQSMVEYALTIEDRNERTQCAYSIIKFMGNLFPYLRDANEFKHKLWDHLAIMSDFKLDIDYPCELVEKNAFFQRPDSLPYPQQRIRYRHYGRLLEDMAIKARELNSESEQRQLLLLIANRMKAIRQDLKYNSDHEDEKIFKDLGDYLQGELKFDLNTLSLSSRKSLNSPQRKNRNNQRRAVR